MKTSEKAKKSTNKRTVKVSKKKQAVVGKSPNKVYLALAAAVTVVLTGASVVSNLQTFPTQKHKDIAQRQQEIVDRNGGWLNIVDTQEKKEYKELSNTNEAKHSSKVNEEMSMMQSWLYFVLLFAVYFYIRRKNVSPTGRGLGATALILTVSSSLSVVLSQTLGTLLNIQTASMPNFNEWFIPVYIGGFLLILLVNFFVLFFIELGYNLVSNKKQ